jgi:hypothetical protein
MNVPTRAPVDWSQAIGPLLFFAAALGALHALPIYQLVAGRANCWPWQTKSKISRWWLYRAEQPVAFWFRIGLWSFLCVFVDEIVLSALVERFG